MNGDPLAGLRDIHLPPDVPVWPLAPGYWALLALAVLALLVAAWRYRHRHRLRLRTEARDAVDVAVARFRAGGDAARLVRDLAEVLRRVALARHGAAVAGLGGERWAAHLRDAAPANCDPSLWTLLAVDRYARTPPATDPEALARQCRRWVVHACR